MMMMMMMMTMEMMDYDGDDDNKNCIDDYGDEMRILLWLGLTISGLLCFTII